MFGVLAGAAFLLLLTGARGGTAPARWTGGRQGVFAILDVLSTQRPSLPRSFIYAMADKESGFNPNSHHGGNEDSLGLFQINWNAHADVLMSRGAQKSWLYDPSFNATYWGELAEGLRREAMNRGYRPPGLWMAIRLRLKGIAWDDFGSPLALETIRRFAPYLAKWEARLG